MPGYDISDDPERFPREEVSAPADGGADRDPEFSQMQAFSPRLLA
jgi:hypothetical protein